MGRSIGRGASAVVSRGDAGRLGPLPHTGSKPRRLPGHGPSERPFTTAPTWHNSRLREKPLGARGPMAQVLREGPAAPGECASVQASGQAALLTQPAASAPALPAPLGASPSALGESSWVRPPNPQPPKICYIYTPLARGVWRRRRGEPLAPADRLSRSQRWSDVCESGGCCSPLPRAGVRAERAGRRHEGDVSGQAPRAP